jgi:hypothetical protein
MSPNRLHCSYHKCLTVYFKNVMHTLYNRLTPWSQGYRHCRSRIEQFYRGVGSYKVLSVNNHRPNFDLLGDFRLSRFIRDPRDLVVSGYFYHLRGTEKWCGIVGPSDDDWSIVNGAVPKGVDAEHSLASYLQNSSLEDGLIAEIGFRKKHFESMLEWPEEDPRILTIRYEDILGSEEEAFNRIFEFYRLPWLDRRLGSLLAGRYSASHRAKQSSHIRNPEPNQWKQHFSPKVHDYFNERYGDLLVRLGY